MIWTERQIAGYLARYTFERKHLVIVPNCSWPGSECDLLVVTHDLRVIDVEIKISRSDLKADYEKEKWYHTYDWRQAQIDNYKGPWEDRPRRRRDWPERVWKHYYAMPAEIWKPELAACVSPVSGILLIKRHPHRDGELYVGIERMAKPNRQADRIKPEDAVYIARLASLRMWDAYEAVDKLNSERATT